MPGQFADAVVVVTGGGSGIGRATALAFARQGARVVIGNRDERRGRETVEQVRAAGGDGLFCQTDVTRAADVRRLIDTAAEASGRLDILFNNAGTFGPIARLAEHDDAALDPVLRTNVAGVFLGMKYALARMLPQGRGVIINNASTTGARNATI